MKKLLPLLILFLMLLASCSLDSFVDAMAGNAFAGNNNANADYVSSAVDSMEKVPTDNAFVAGDSFTIDFDKLPEFKAIAEAFDSSDGFRVNLGAYADKVRDNGLLSPQTDEETTALYNSLSGALGSTSGIASLSDQLAESAPEVQSNAAKGSIALVLALNDTIEKDGLDPSIKDMLDDLTIELDSKVKPGETLSKAEVLQVQIITNTVVAIANAADQLVPGEDGEIDFGTPEDQPYVWSAIDGLTLLSSLQNNLDSDVSMIDIPDVSDIISSALGTGSSSEEGATV